MAYHYIFIPIVAGIIAQVIKLAIDATKGKFSWKNLNSYGGMPSAHSAFVVSLAALVGYFEGFDSAFFGIAFILAIIIIRDAGGYRRVIGTHAKELNQIVHSLSPEYTFQYSHLPERIGHTPLQIFFGSLIGLLTVVLYLLII